MVRGKTLFRCTKCNKIFSALDIEWNATVFSVPMRCPKCESIRTLPFSLYSFFSSGVYEDIWKIMEQREKEQNENSMHQS